MKYKGKDGKVPFTTLPREMFDRAMEIDTGTTTRKVLGWMLKEIVSDNKGKVQGEWEIQCEGFTPKTWIHRDTGVTENDVNKSIKELEERHILTTVPHHIKIYKTEDGKYHKRETTYCKVNDPKVWNVGKIPRKHKEVKEDNGNVLT